MTTPFVRVPSRCVERQDVAALAVITPAAIVVIADCGDGEGWWGF